jgi:hypothetical protein
VNKDQLIIKLQALPLFKGNIELKIIEGLINNDNYTDKMLERYQK